MKKSRRDFLKIAGATGITTGLAAIGVLGGQKVQAESFTPIGSTPAHGVHAGLTAGVKAPQSQALNVIDPTSFLTNFEQGKFVALENGERVREFNLVSYPSLIEVASGVKFPAWTLNGTVPGPTLRCIEGETVRIRFRNGDAHPHTIHLHGIHPASMDGVFEIVEPGQEYVYEFTAQPFGVFPYHCHVMPLTKHVSKGLYGTLIVDPKTPRQAAKEMVMLMNGFDVDFDGENEFYTVNGIANYYTDYPIQIKVNEPVRVYLVNMTEFDKINSLHLHANMFWYYPNGTILTPAEYTDTVMLCQGQRGILEFSYKYPGRYLFHAHQSEFAELGWTGIIEVTE